MDDSFLMLACSITSESLDFLFASGNHARNSAPCGQIRQKIQVTCKTGRKFIIGVHVHSLAIRTDRSKGRKLPKVFEKPTNKCYMYFKCTFKCDEEIRGVCVKFLFRHTRSPFLQIRSREFFSDS